MLKINNKYKEYIIKIKKIYFFLNKTKKFIKNMFNFSIIDKLFKKKKKKKIGKKKKIINKKIKKKNNNNYE